MKDEKLINECYYLVKSFFQDKSKTLKWFNTPNPLLGNVKPLQMIHEGRVKKLIAFIKSQKMGYHS